MSKSIHRAIDTRMQCCVVLSARRGWSQSPRMYINLASGSQLLRQRSHVTSQQHQLLTSSAHGAASLTALLATSTLMTCLKVNSFNAIRLRYPIEHYVVDAFIFAISLFLILRIHLYHYRSYAAVPP